MGREQARYKVAIGRLVEINGKVVPKKLDHFLLYSRGGKGEWIPDDIATRALSSDAKPKTLNVILCAHSAEEAFTTSYAMVAKNRTGKMICRGDGVKALRREDLDQNKPFAVFDGPCGNGCEFLQTRACKPCGILSFRFSNGPLAGESAFIRTTSWNSVRAISSSLNEIASYTGGAVDGIPMTLAISPMVTRYSSGTGQREITIYVLSLSFHPSRPDRRAAELLAHREYYLGRPMADIPIEPIDESESVDSTSTALYYPTPENNDDDFPSDFIDDEPSREWEDVAEEDYDQDVGEEPLMVGARPLKLSDFPKKDRQLVVWYISRAAGCKTLADVDNALLVAQLTVEEIIAKAREARSSGQQKEMEPKTGGKG